MIMAMEPASGAVRPNCGSADGSWPYGQELFLLW